ncbi:restriction endonuclease subunit S [Nocardiopsis sp. YSL2]|uniref:restriction endonuclease subunit S n=1 Tax=Nocardiopsis sp. YSL2 TaxID=2939492 RepID=UPI0026F43945|nr:restriction endonuclease subunit S [Nocardiopsis sp. YSL2]
MRDTMSWPLVRLRDIAVICSGGTPSRDDLSLWGGEIPWLTPGELSGLGERVVTRTAEEITSRGVRSSGAVVLPVGALMVTTRATLGACAIAGVPMATNQGFKNLIFQKEIANPEFYFYVLKALVREMTRRANGTTFLEISANEFGNLEVPLPSVVEQRRIVQVIDAVAVQEHAIRESISKLRSVRRGTLLSAMAPLREGKPPHGWERVPLSDVVPLAEYGVSEALDRDPRGLPVLRMNNLENGALALSDLRYSPVPVSDRLRLKQGDVLFNRTNSIDHVGKVALWRGELPEASFASYLVRINPDASRLMSEYLVEWLMHPLIRQRVRSVSTPAVQQVNVNPTRLRDLEIDMPTSLDEQRRIIESLYVCDEKITGEQLELKKLEGLKQGIVDNLLSGKV